MVCLKVANAPNFPSRLRLDLLHRLVDDDLQNELPTPYCNLSDHSLPVTDIVCGAGSFPSCRILTSSADHTAKVRTPSYLAASR